MLNARTGKGASGRGWFKKRRLRLVLASLVLVVYVLLFSGKPFALPLGFAYVPADVNGWRRGDLLVLLSSRVVPVLNETYVVACYPGYWNTACVSGLVLVNGANGVNGVLRVVSVYNGNGFNNGFLRVHVVTPDFTVYGVVAVVPREVAIPLQLAFFLYASILLYRATRASSRRALGENVVFLPVLLLVLAVNMTVVGATYVEQARVAHRIDGMIVKYEFNLVESRLYIHVDTGGLYDVRNASCHVLLGYSAVNANNGYPARPLTTRVTNGVVVVEIPWEVYEELYAKTTSNLALTIVPEYLSVYSPQLVKCAVSLDIGTIAFTAVVEVYWKDVNVTYHNGTLALVNPNPIPLKALVALVDARGTVRVVEVWIERLGETRINTGELGFQRGSIVVQYDLLGLTRSRVVQVD